MMTVQGRDVSATVEAEEPVYSDRYSNNGASPMWCFGNTCVARVGDEVFVSGYERLPRHRPYNDCRWVLFKRTTAGWERAQADETGRQREPCPLGCLPPATLLMSSNPTLLPPDADGGGPARPELIEFDAANPKTPGRRVAPTWKGNPEFTEHSYRSMAVDAANGDVILFQNVGYSHSAWALRDRSGQWLSGRLPWPAYTGADLAPFGATHARVDYPAVILRNRAVHFFGASSYDNWSRVTTQEGLQCYTGPDAGSMGGWVFGMRTRRLFYTHAEPIGERPFREWIEIDNAFDDGGFVWPGDMHVDSSGTAHLLWYKGPMQRHARDTWFPDIPLVASLRYATVRDGAIPRCQTLAVAGEDGPVKAFGETKDSVEIAFHGDSRKIRRGSIMATPRFHVTPEGRIFVVYYVSGKRADGTELSENRILDVRADGRHTAPMTLPLKHPLTPFFTATPRAGCAPSWTLDLLGNRLGSRRPATGSTLDEYEDAISYAQVRLQCLYPESGNHKEVRHVPETVN